MKKKKMSFYPEDFKLKVVNEVLSGKFTKEEARKVYGIKSNCAILYWMRKFSGNDNYRQGGQPFENADDIKKMKELTEQEKKIQKLEEALQRERFRADLWQKMVEIAEEQLQVDIRKKFGAKQSTPSKNKQEGK
jgi:transposase-like protein